MHKITYIGNGDITEFSFAFPFFQQADVKVAVNDQVWNYTQYDVTPNDELDGGIVTLMQPLAKGCRLDIFRQVSLERIVDYQPTVKIDPESLNTDFNFLLAAFQDLRAIDIDLSEWKNIHDNVLNQIQNVEELIKDKLSGGAALGLYNNLLATLNDALPKLINDYGSVTIPAPNENRDDYGLL